MNPETLELHKPCEHVLQVTLKRPKSYNAINSVMMHDLYELWHEISQENDGIRCVVLTGSGTKAFCAGADLKERNNLSRDVWREQHSFLEKAAITMLKCPIPIISAVNGAAFGGGLELVLLSDFAYACRAATFGQSETKLGLMPGMMGTQLLQRAVGLRRAKQLMFTGETFTAKQASEWGLINEVTTAKALLETAIETANRIAANAPIAVRYCKKAVLASLEQGPIDGYHTEIEAYNRLLNTHDLEEGISAFNEKRSPEFTGE